MESEAGPLLRATGSPKTQPGRRSRQKPGDGAEAPPAQGLPSAASVPLLPPPAGRGGARREHKRLQLPSGRRPTPPTPGLGPARGEEAGRKRQGGRERARMGRAGDPGPPARVGVGSGGRGPGVTRAPGTPRIAEKRVSKNRQRLARICGRPKRNKEHPPTPLRRRPRPPLTRAERSGGSRAARKKAVPPHSGAGGKEEGRKRTPPRREELSTPARESPPPPLPPPQLLSAPTALRPRRSAPSRTDSGASPAAASPSLGRYH